MKKYLFFRMPRTGSTFLTSTLQEKRGDQIEIVDHERLYKDGTRDAKGVSDDHLWRFCLVRNPYERFVSAYRWLRVPRKYSEIDSNERSAVLRYKDFFDFCSSLEEFTSDSSNSPIHFYPQHLWITDAAGNLTMDYVGKFEGMNEAWKVIAEKLSLEYYPVFGEHRKTVLGKASLVRKKLFDVIRGELLNDDIIGILQEFYRKDFELFGYPKEYVVDI